MPVVLVFTLFEVIYTSLPYLVGVTECHRGEFELLFVVHLDYNVSTVLKVILK